MNPWFETFIVTVAAIFGVISGKKLSLQKKSRWIWGYIISIAIIGLIVSANYFEKLQFISPLLWMTTSRVKFVVLALAVTVGLTTPLSKLPYKFEKVIIGFSMVIVVIWFCILPMLFPALLKNKLSNIKTRVDLTGLCYQTTDYTCGPAAAVTALGKLGLAGEEGEIAILAHSSPAAGTLPQSLCSALQQRYGINGLKCSYKSFSSVEELKNDGVVLAVIKDSFMVDHCVTVLDVLDNAIVIADPATGRQTMSRNEFEQIWRFCGIVLKRTVAENS